MRRALIFASLVAAAWSIALLTVRLLGLCVSDDAATCTLVLLAFGSAWGARVLDESWG